MATPLTRVEHRSSEADLDAMWADQENAWHYWVAWEMACEKRFIEREIFFRDHPGPPFRGEGQLFQGSDGMDLEHAIQKEEWVTMRQIAMDAVDSKPPSGLLGHEFFSFFSMRLSFA